MASFFGIQAATVTAHRRLMDISNAVAIPLYFYRSGDIRDPQYNVLVEPKLENFPSECEVNDAERVNKIIENQIRSPQHNTCGFIEGLKLVLLVKRSFTDFVMPCYTVN